MDSLRKMVNRPAYSSGVQNSILLFVFIFFIGLGLIISGSTGVFSKKTATEDEKSVLKFRLILSGSIILIIGLVGIGLVVY